jgi:hypothetical protein
MSVDGFDDATPVAAFGPRMVCTACGIIGAYSMKICWHATSRGDNAYY